MGNLTARAIAKAKTPGRYGDGEGLALIVGKTGSKSWIVRVQKDGRRRDIGLGNASKVPLKLARECVAELRQIIELGIDPVAERAKAAGIRTFSVAVKKVHAEIAPNWKNAKHAVQWIIRLETYTVPSKGNRFVADIDAAAVHDFLVAISPDHAGKLSR